MSEWERLGDHVDLLTGFPFKSDEYTSEPDGVLLLRGDNLAQRRIRWDGAQRWPKDGAADFDDYRLQVGDVVLAMDRPWIEAGLKVAEVRNDSAGALLVQRVSRLRARAELDQGFLKWLLYCQEFTDYILSVQTGTAVPHISSGQIADFRFKLPPLSEQRAIARVLGALDDLIETNRVLAKRLDQLATAASARFMMSVADREAVPLSRFCSATKGFSYKSAELAEGPDLLVNLKNVGRHGTFERRGFKRLNSDRYKDAQVVVPGDLIVSMTDLTQAREVVARPVRVPAVATTGRMVASLDLAIVRPENGYSREFLTAALAQEDFHTFALGYCNGTTVVHLSGRVFDDYQLPNVAPEETSEISAVLSVLNAQSDACTSEIDELTRARDEMLPLLMSGRVRVREAA